MSPFLCSITHICNHTHTRTHTHLPALPISPAITAVTAQPSFAVMAPALHAAFVAVDVAKIKAEVKASGEKPAKGEVRQLECPPLEDQECKRLYVFKNRNWHYMGTLNTVTNTMFDMPETPAPVTESDNSDQSDREAEQPASLHGVLAALEALHFTEAKDMIRAMIAAAQPKKGKGKKAKDAGSSDDELKPKRKLSDYTLFIQAEMLKIRESEPAVLSRDVMRLAMERWRAYKQANGIVTAAEKKALIKAPAPADDIEVA